MTPSYAKVISDLQRLLVRVADHEEELPHAGEVRLELEAAVQDLKAIKQRQKQHWWAWRQACKELQQGLAAGLLVASRLRSLVKEQWGKFDPRLVEFNMMPLRLRRKAERALKPNGSERLM